MWWRESCKCDDTQSNEDSAFECVPYGVSTDSLTEVSKARLGRGGWISQCSGPSFHPSVAHGVAKTGGEMVMVAHSSTDPSRVSLSL
jgi:hypothetical protein